MNITDLLMKFDCNEIETAYLDINNQLTTAQDCVKTINRPPQRFFDCLFIKARAQAIFEIGFERADDIQMEIYIEMLETAVRNRFQLT